MCLKSGIVPNAALSAPAFVVLIVSLAWMSFVLAVFVVFIRDEMSSLVLRAVISVGRKLPVTVCMQLIYRKSPQPWRQGFVFNMNPWISVSM